MTSSADPYRYRLGRKHQAADRMGAKKGPSTRIYIGEWSFTVQGRNDDCPPHVRSRLGNDAGGGRVRVGAKKRP